MRIAYWLLLPITVFITVYQIRYSIAAIEASQTFLYIPFGLKPFTNEIDSVTHVARMIYDPDKRDGLYRGDELIAVNGRPFVGAAVLSQELRSARRYLDAANTLPPPQAADAVMRWPFSVTVRSDGKERTTPVYFANCTCGGLSVPQVF